MAIAGSPKTLLLSCSVQVFRTQTNWQPGNTWIISQLLPITKHWTSSHEFSKKSLEEGLKHLDKAHPSRSSLQQRTLGKSALSVAKQTTPHKITGLGGSVHKRARDKSLKNCQIHLETRKQANKRHKLVPMYWMYQNYCSCLYKLCNQSISPVMKWVRK